MEKPVVTRKTTTRTTKRTTKKAQKRLSAEERYQMIAEAAYFIAERRGFQPGDPKEDWLEAEKEISQTYC